MHVLKLKPNSAIPFPEEDHSAVALVIESENIEEAAILTEVAEKIARAKNYRQRLPGMLKTLLPFLV